MFIVRTGAEAETPLWPPDAKSWHIGQGSEARKDWKQEKRCSKGWDGLDSITYSMDKSLGELWEIMKDREPWHAAVHGITSCQTQLSNWKTVLAQTHLTSHSKMSGSRWLITPSWLSGSLRSFWGSLCVCVCVSSHLILISSASVRSLQFLFFNCAHLCM